MLDTSSALADPGLHSAIHPHGIQVVVAPAGELDPVTGPGA
jgi:uncharacterized protein YwbE